MLFRSREKETKESKHASKSKAELVPYKLASYEHDHEGKRFKSSKVVYSFWSASKYVLVLSLVLWWLPMFGQMIAGYVGGRRAGGPWKGVAASILPVVCLYAVIEGFESGALPSQVFGVTIAPAALAASLGSSVPIISPYLQFSSEYVGSFVKMLEGSSPYGINVYVLTVAFAYVGGVLAEQSRREIEFTSGAVVSSTTVLVHDSAAHAQRADDYLQESPEPRGIGAVLAGVTSRFHRHPQEVPAVTVGATHHQHHRHKHRDPWAGAAQMRYAEEPEDDERTVPPMGEPMEYPDDYGAYAYPSRRHRHSKDQWNVNKRRGRPNMSAKPRFRYAQYEGSPRSDRSDAPEWRSGGYSSGATGAWRRPRRDKQYLTVSPDPKSIKRATRMIEREWGGSARYRSLNSDSEALEKPEPETVAHHRKEHASHTWDTI